MAFRGCSNGKRAQASFLVVAWHVGRHSSSDEVGAESMTRVNKDFGIVTSTRYNAVLGKVSSGT